MDLKIIPRMSEKSYAESKSGIYVFNVPLRTTKQQVASAVAKQFEVKVQTVNITVVKGKAKKNYRKGGAPVVGKRKDVKKAYVRLAEGNTIPVFASAETEEKK